MSGSVVAPQLPNGALYNWSCIDSQGVGTCQLGALSVIMRNAMIALYVITVYLGFGVNLVGGILIVSVCNSAFAPTDTYDIEMTALLYLIRPLSLRNLINLWCTAFSSTFERDGRRDIGL